MAITKQMNIKNKTYYFYNDLFNITDFEKTSMGFNTYNIGYITKKPQWNVNSVNPLYLMMNRIDGCTE